MLSSPSDAAPRSCTALTSSFLPTLMSVLLSKIMSAAAARVVLTRSRAAAAVGLPASTAAAARRRLEGLCSCAAAPAACSGPCSWSSYQACSAYTPRDTVTDGCRLRVHDHAASVRLDTSLQGHAGQDRMSLKVGSSKWQWSGASYTPARAHLGEQVTSMSLASVSNPENWRRMLFSAEPTPAEGVRSRGFSSAA